MNGGHGWWYWGEKNAIPWLARKIVGMKKGQLVQSKKHYKIYDNALCSRAAKQILDWKFDVLLDLHTPENVWLKSNAYQCVAQLCKPMAEERWGYVNFLEGSLAIEASYY